MEAVDRNVATAKADEYTEVEIVYALPECQLLKSLRVPIGSTVKQVVCSSGILDQFPEIDLEKNRLGIFGKLVAPETVIQPRDRVEIYRPLLIDPKEARKLRVSRKRVK